MNSKSVDQTDYGTAIVPREEHPWTRPGQCHQSYLPPRFSHLHHSVCTKKLSPASTMGLNDKMKTGFTFSGIGSDL